MTPGQEEEEVAAERNVKGIPLHKEVVGWIETTCKEMDIPVDFLEAPQVTT
jgi:LDH2 family malate/lactate/ureidoglycolate dehydrogenase